MSSKLDRRLTDVRAPRLEVRSGRDADQGCRTCSGRIRKRIVPVTGIRPSRIGARLVVGGLRSSPNGVGRVLERPPPQDPPQYGYRSSPSARSLPQFCGDRPV